MRSTKPLARSVLVIFGGSGDLARRKILPALDEIRRMGLMPEGLVLLAVGRKKAGDVLPGLKGMVSDGLAESLHYLEMEYDHEGFLSLRKACAKLTQQDAVPDCLFHLAVPPAVFEGIISGLRSSGMIHPLQGDRWSRLLVEKPFGLDAESASKLNGTLKQAFSEDQIFRVDHYLGKAGTKLLLDFRLARPDLEAVWNSRFIAKVRIVSKESMGCENRSGYFDGVGILRDMVQSHLMQLLSLIVMSLPEDEWESMREEKIRGLSGVRLWKSDPGLCSVRGQYVGESAEGWRVPGYIEEAGVKTGSKTETYASIGLGIDSERWMGVQFNLEAGKRMDRKETLVEILFRDCSDPGSPPELPESIQIRIQPYPAIIARFPGGRTERLDSGQEFAGPTGEKGAREPDGYAALLSQALLGRQSMFVHADEINAAWRCLEPVLRHWNNGSDGSDILGYPPGWDGVRYCETISERNRNKQVCFYGNSKIGGGR